MSKTLTWVGGLVVLVALGAFGYWTISPYFRKVTVNDALPQAPVSNDQSQPATGATGGQPVVLAAGTVVGTSGHPASGQATLVQVDNAMYVRYENFHTLNGPDIYVYLSKDKDAKDFVNLGKVKATDGNVNYEVPAGVDATQYPYVLTWCKTFSVLFNSAELVPTE